jgi:hypothetical protein
MGILSRINDWCRRELGGGARATEKPRLVGVALPESQIRFRLTSERRDFVITTSESGEVTAVCNVCESAVQSMWSGPLLWFQCPSCRRISFNPGPNVTRDAEFARKDGTPFRYELFYMDNLPAELGCPFEK